MNKYFDREIQYISFPFSGTLDDFNIENLRIIFFPSRSVDIGSLCYIRRDFDQKRVSTGKGRRVDLSSFSLPRRENAKRLISYFTNQYISSGKKPVSLYGAARCFMAFIDWCDSKSLPDPLLSLKVCRDRFFDYSNHLRLMTQQSLLSTNAASDYQNTLLIFLNDYYEVDDFSAGVDIIKKDFKTTEHREVSDSSSQEKVFSFSCALFEGLCQLTIDKNLYPFKLSLPAFLNYKNDSLWLFPVVRWFLNTSIQTQKDYFAYDYFEGRLRSKEELVPHLKYAYNIKLILDNANACLERSNADFQSKDRIERGSLALKTFFLIFIAITGMNPSQVASLKWNDEADISAKSPIPNRQGFRTIKYRANNKIVHFEIGVKYMGLFRRYLELRKYLLNGTESELLFFRHSKKRDRLTNNPLPVLPDICVAVYKIFLEIAPNLPRVMPSNWRASKQDFLIRNFDPVTTAIVMQHSLETSQKNYTNGSKETMKEELGNYLNKVENSILLNKDSKSNEFEHSLGFCESPNNPKQFNNETSLVPDCKRTEGCLFCKQYRVHADNKDIRKLLSARFCIEKISHLATNNEQHERSFKPILDQINSILGLLRKHNSSLVELIENEVYIDGELDQVWASKYESLLEFDLV